MTTREFDVVIIGGGAGGIATAASIHKRNRRLRICIVEPSDIHRYQPGLTLVGGGIFKNEQTSRPMRSVIPGYAHWVSQKASTFMPAANEVGLDNQDSLKYKALVVAPGLTLDWDGIDGLAQTLGRNGVTSNYSMEHAPYTWELVSNLKRGRAVFTQAPMPIKCAGAPQKAVYLSCHAWERTNRLGDIDVAFYNAGGALFGVADYVPALQRYMDRYGVHCHYAHELCAVDGPNRLATFQTGDGAKQVEFDMLHVCPPQVAPAFVAASELANGEGWVDVDQHTLQHSTFPNVFGLGDVASTPNAKTAAAVRKQAPVVAANLVAHLEGKDPVAVYDGYGSCPLTVEKGKVVLAEFGYGGKLLPTAPTWLLNGKKTHTSGLEPESDLAASDLLRSDAQRSGMVGQARADRCAGRGTRAGGKLMTDRADDGLKPLTFWEILGSTFAAALGVQRYENRKRDFTRGNVVHFIIAGVLFVICFVVGMIFLVNLVIGQST